MKKLKEFWENLRYYGEAEMEIEINLVHVIVVVLLIAFAIYTFL